MIFIINRLWKKVIPDPWSLHPASHSLTRHRRVGPLFNCHWNPSSEVSNYKSNRLLFCKISVVSVPFYLLKICVGRVEVVWTWLLCLRCSSSSSPTVVITIMVGTVVLRNHQTTFHHHSFFILHSFIFINHHLFISTLSVTRCSAILISNSNQLPLLEGKKWQLRRSLCALPRSCCLCLELKVLGSEARNFEDLSIHSDVAWQMLRDEKVNFAASKGSNV